MYNPDQYFDASEYIQTSTGNIVSRKAVIFRPEQVELPGGRCIIKPGVIIRGDFAPVQIQRYCVIGENTILRPSYTISKTFKFIPLTIGKYSYIGENCIIESAVIGAGCDIGDDCILSMRCILKDHVKVESGSVVPPDMVVPPFSILSGCPARIIGEVQESATTLAQVEAIARFKSNKAIGK
mmetsp:Transcript_10858/g.10872  ORF Transcript_10858/g.10872 Transcript_10858/m.10872 type:complete len:182 (+) Transcript_10858:172-717(+)|eukprot:CAMPEP_0182417950 /NCGR_PEP_ID=MMETSP1167-20130531/2410_1 /TAXON_ID=2988 /ORGANISM="Mallomonas Sp, Strain CCMP3275" /LENGTH=181 /DNA_ID=CAMNT_0024591859 /DNA_START=67 /DNA_END=612 /DNA_ORIENTATION=+